MSALSQRHARVALLCSVLLSACEPAPQSGTFPTLKAHPLPAAEEPALRPDDMPRGRKRLTFGVTPYLGVQRTREAFEPIAKWIGTRLGVPVEFVIADGYDELVEQAVKGKLDIVQFSPLSYIVAKERVSGLRLVASSLSFGSADYSSLLVVRSGSKLRALGDVVPQEIRAERQRRKRRGDDRPVHVPDRRRVRFGYVHERSASGYLLPYEALLAHGVDPQRDIDMVRMGSHEAAVEALIKGQVDLAAVSSGTLNNVRRGVIIGVGNLRILYKAGRIPYDALCTAPHVPESGARKIAAAFGALSTRDAVGRGVLASARGVTGWAATTEERYAFLRKHYLRVRAEEWREQGRRHRHGGADRPKAGRGARPASPARPLPRAATSVLP